MYKLLIVDDELYSVEAVRTCIDWEAHGFSEVVGAYDADEAKDILLQDQIDVMLCDIEMPGWNGIQLLEWMCERGLSTVTVFLTGHADFNYAQQAIKLGGFDYLLKPIKYEQLAEVITRAVAEVEKHREQQSIHDIVEHYEQLWNSKQPMLKERFWQDALAGRIKPTPEAASDHQVELGQGELVVPILLSVENWFKEFSQRDEEIMEYALRNAASELLFAEGRRGDIIADRNGILFAMLYVKEMNDRLSSDMGEACGKYIEACSDYFYCSLSCYIGEAVPPSETANVYYRLVEMERTVVAESGEVYHLRDASFSIPALGTLPTVAMDAEEWTLLLESGRKDELLVRLDALFESEIAHGVTSETLAALYHTLLGFIYQAVHQRGLSVKQLTDGSKWQDESAATRSIPQFKAWARKMLTLTADCLHRHRNKNSALIEKVKAYIHVNLDTVTRERIAAHVYLNSAHLSRLFKRETGQSLVEYIIGVKMNKAKAMLIETNDKIGEISDSLGYENFSHFAKMFKKQTGMTPQEYRRRYQSLGG